MANRWINNENSDRFCLLGLQNHCGWLQPWNYKTLAPWKGSFDKARRCMKKQRPHFADKVSCSQSCGFSSSLVQMWELDHEEDWVPRLLRVPWIAQWWNQSILKEISPEYSLEGMMLKLQFFAPWCKELTHWKRPQCWERSRAGGEGDNRGWDGWMASPTQWTWVWASSRSWWWTWRPGTVQSMGLQKVGHNLATEQQQQLPLMWCFTEREWCPKQI